MRAIFKNCSGLQKKISALLLRSPRPLEKKKSGRGSGRNQRERNRKAQLKKDLMLAGGTRAYKILRSFKASNRLSRRKRISYYELQILNLNLPKRPRFVSSPSHKMSFFYV
ncbi:unnamed protein product [Rhizophagus irregularis]|nr:unnamed protein product [Rhizophagus irregularis]